jgi:hypothetical protein
LQQWLLNGLGKGSERSSIGGEKLTFRGCRIVRFIFGCVVGVENLVMSRDKSEIWLKSVSCGDLGVVFG